MGKVFNTHEETVYKYYDTKKDFESIHYEGVDGYPYAKYRMEMILEILEKHNCRNILDLGCSTGRIVREWILRGNKGVGVDFSEQLISQGKRKMEASGIDSKCLMIGNAKDFSSYKTESFDAVLALGLYTFMKEEEEIESCRKIKRILKPSGLLITSYLNELVNIFTLNRYTVDTFCKIIENYKMDESEKTKVLTEYKVLLTNPNAPLPKPSDTFRRTHNPLVMPIVINNIDYECIDLFFCKFFAFPPLLESKIDFYEKYCKELEIKHAREWYAYFTAHAFCMVSQKLDNSKGAHRSTS